MSIVGRDAAGEPGEPREPRFVSIAFDDIPAPDFADVQVTLLRGRAPTDPVVWADTIFSARSTPLWVKLAVALRQLLVPLMGVPPAGRGVFDVDRVVGEEALVAHDDVHLDFRAAVGVDAEAGLVRVTTAVRFHGWRGRLYFVPVRLLHGPVVRAMLRRAARRLARRGWLRRW